MRLMSWPDGERYLRPLQSLVVSLLSSFVSTLFRLEAYCLIEILGHIGSLDFHQGACAPSSCLCSLSSSLQQTQPSVKFLSLYDWQNRESFLQRLQTLVPGHLSSHSALSSYGLYVAHSLATLCLCTTSGPGRGELPGFWGSMVFRHAPIPRKGSGKHQQQEPHEFIFIATISELE